MMAEPFVPQKLLEKILTSSSGCKRYVVAIAGPPGAGKSTLAHNLAGQLPGSRVLQMDGFHYDNSVLSQLGLCSRKGAPETFDFSGFSATLSRVKACERHLVVPVFDRNLDLARAGAEMIDESIKFILVEGNYLLLDETPWRDLIQYFDFSVFLDVPRSELFGRLMRRWLDHGRTVDEAEHWVTTNDMPNVDRVLHSRLSPESVMVVQQAACLP